MIVYTIVQLTYKLYSDNFKLAKINVKFNNRNDIILYTVNQKQKLQYQATLESCKASTGTSLCMQSTWNHSKRLVYTLPCPGLETQSSYKYNGLGLLHYI